MTSTFDSTKVGCGALIGFLALGSVSPAQARTETAKGDTKPKVVQMTPKESAAPPKSGEPHERLQLGLGFGFFTESSERRQENFIGGQETRREDPVEFESDSIYNLQAWLLTPAWFRGFRWGGGVAWFNKYALELPDADDDDDPYRLGHLFQLGLQAEYEIERVASKLNVLFGLRTGASLLFPSGNLRTAIEGLERRGFEVWVSPRPGVYLAPLAGVRWPITDRAAVRADISVQFSELWLYNAEGESVGITSQSNATLTTTRTQFLLGLDFGL
jgi:hypothetical protein